MKDKIFTIKGVSFIVKYVEGGRFMMGATPEQLPNAWSDELPAHQVKLNEYYIGETQVTQALWKAVMGTHPSYFKRSINPVECVSLLDIKPIYRAYNLLRRNEYHSGCRLMEKWDDDIRRSINQSSELAELRKKAAKNGDLDRVVIDFSVKHILQYFSIEYNPDYFDWSAVTYGILPNKHIRNVDSCQNRWNDSSENTHEYNADFQEGCPF